jgi:hypothetical protein
VALSLRFPGGIDRRRITKGGNREFLARLLFSIALPYPKTPTKLPALTATLRAFGRRLVIAIEKADEAA